MQGNNEIFKHIAKLKADSVELLKDNGKLQQMLQPVMAQVQANRADIDDAYLKEFDKQNENVSKLRNELNQTLKNIENGFKHNG